MSKSAKQSKTTNNAETSTSVDEPTLPIFTMTAAKEDSQEWTSAQLKQIELAKKLDDYISSFQKKLLGLNFAPSDRELVILFIMYLHPRWRRFVEPMELSCSTWIEAAAYARLHCGRVSAMLGCEKIGSNCIFSTPESRALRDSNYFAPDEDAKETQPLFEHKPLIPQDPRIDATNTIITTIPAKHRGVNLMFLDLPVEGETVRALVAKASWEKSAISIKCIERLGLELNHRNDLGLETAFGSVGAVGECLLPFCNPADPEKEIYYMRILVLPMIYGDSVELILGADFFCEYQCVLNIRTRAIHFLGKETPYIVDRL